MGLSGLGSFALWFEATVKLLSSAHQGGRHIAEARHAPRPTAWLRDQTTSARSGRASRDAVGAVFAPTRLPWLPQFSFPESIAVLSQPGVKGNPTNETMLTNFEKNLFMITNLHASEIKGMDPFVVFVQILKRQEKLQKEPRIILQKKIGFFCPGAGGCCILVSFTESAFQGTPREKHNFNDFFV